MPPPLELDSIWSNKIEPELQSLFASNDIDYAGFTAVYAAVFDITTASRWAPGKPPSPALYEKLDEFLAATARSVLLRAPADDSFPDYYIAAYAQYTATLNKIKHLFAYLERHWISHEQDAGNGWLRHPPVNNNKDNEEQRVKREKDKEDALRKWGYVDGEGSKARAAAESRGQAASELMCIVPPHSLGLRRWRLEVVHPLLADGSAAAATVELGKCGLLRKIIQAWIAEGTVGEQREKLSGIERSFADVGVVAEDVARVEITRHLTLS